MSTNTNLRIPAADANGDIVKARFTSFLQEYAWEPADGEEQTVQQR